MDLILLREKKKKTKYEWFSIPKVYRDERDILQCLSAYVVVCLFVYLHACMFSLLLLLLIWLLSLFFACRCRCWYFWSSPFFIQYCYCLFVIASVCTRLRLHYRQNVNTVFVSFVWEYHVKSGHNRNWSTMLLLQDDTEVWLYDLNRVSSPFKRVLLNPKVRIKHRSSQKFVSMTKMSILWLLL